MIKGAKSFQQKYEKIMGESSADKLWNDVKNGINEFTKKIELGQADGYFWNMYFNLLRENRILFEGVNKAIVTGDMNYMFIRKIVLIVFIKTVRIVVEHRQLIL